MIPTKSIVKYCHYVRKNEDAKGKESNSAKECSRSVTTEIENVRHKFSFPTIEGIFSKVFRLIEKAYNLNKTSDLEKIINLMPN